MWQHNPEFLCSIFAHPKSKMTWPSFFLSLLTWPQNLTPSQNISTSPSIEKKWSRPTQNELMGNDDPKSSSISASYTFLKPLLFANPSRSKQEREGSCEQVWRSTERDIGDQALLLPIEENEVRGRKETNCAWGKYTEMVLILTQTSCWPWGRSF